MWRSFTALIAVVGLMLGAITGLPGAHRCAIASAQAAAEDHSCCPDKQQATADSDDPELCSGDCCSSDSEMVLTTLSTPPVPRTFTVLPVEGDAAPVFVASRAKAVGVAWPRGPPPHPPPAPTWLRNQAFLL